MESRPVPVSRHWKQSSASEVPGTLCAHPFDVLKIRMQTTSTGTYADAARHIAGGPKGLLGFYGGLVPALEQRYATA